MICWSSAHSAAASKISGAPRTSERRHNSRPVGSDIGIIVVDCLQIAARPVPISPVPIRPGSDPAQARPKMCPCKTCGPKPFLQLHPSTPRARPTHRRPTRPHTGPSRAPITPDPPGTRARRASIAAPVVAAAVAAGASVCMSWTPRPSRGTRPRPNRLVRRHRKRSEGPNDCATAPRSVSQVSQGASPVASLGNSPRQGAPGPQKHIYRLLSQVSPVLFQKRKKRREERGPPPAPRSR